MTPMKRHTKFMELNQFWGVGANEAYRGKHSWTGYVTLYYVLLDIVIFHMKHSTDVHVTIPGRPYFGEVQASPKLLSQGLHTDLISQDAAGIIKLESLLQKNMNNWVSVCQKAMENQRGYEMPPLPISELGVVAPEHPTAHQRSIMSILDIVLNEDQREHSAQFQKVLGNLRDVSFALQWIMVVSHCVPGVSFLAKACIL